MKKKFPVGLLLCMVPVLAAIAVGIFIIYTLILRTAYKAETSKS